MPTKPTTFVRAARSTEGPGYADIFARALVIALGVVALGLVGIKVALGS